MSLNQLIAQGAQFKQPESPLNMMAKMMEMQNLQRSSEMDQMKMAEMRRATAEAEQFRNAFRGGADVTSDAFLNNLMTIAPKPGMDYAKSVREQREAALKNDKMRTELVDARLKQSRAFLDTIDPNSPDAAERYMQWHQANHADPILGEALKARGVSAEQSLATIQRAMQTPGGLAQLINQSKLGTEKFMEMNKPHFINQDTGGSLRTLAVPGLGGAAAPVAGTETTKVLSPGERSTAQTAANRLAFESDPTQQANIAGAKTGAVEQTKNTITAQAGVPAALERVNKINSVISQMIGDANVNPKTGKVETPKGGARPHKGFEVAVGASAQPGFQWVPGTDKADFYALKDQITSDAFLSAYTDSLKGGGAITEIEGAKGTQALLRARTAQSEPEFIKALREFQQSNIRMAEILKSKAGGGAPAAPTSPSIPAFTQKIPEGWELHTDAKGNKAYVSPDRKSFIEVK